MSQGMSFGMHVLIENNNPHVNTNYFTHFQNVVSVQYPNLLLQFTGDGQPAVPYIYGNDITYYYYDYCIFRYTK